MGEGDKLKLILQKEEIEEEEESSDDEELKVMGRMTMKRESNAICELMSGDQPGLVITGEQVKPLEVGHFNFQQNSRPVFAPRK